MLNPPRRTGTLPTVADVRFASVLILAVLSKVDRKEGRGDNKSRKKIIFPICSLLIYHPLKLSRVGFGLIAVTLISKPQVNLRNSLQLSRSRGRRVVWRTGITPNQKG